MGATSRYGWPVPNASSPVDVPGDMSNLANAMEESIGGLDDRLTTLTGLSQSVFQYTVLTRVSINHLNIPNAVWTPIVWDAAQYNKPDSMPGFTLSSPTRITIHQTGLYRVSGFAGLVANGAGNRALSLRVNGNGGSSAYTTITSADAPTGIGWYGNVSVEARFNADDFAELCLRQTSGDDLAMDPVQPRFSMQRVA